MMKIITLSLFYLILLTTEGLCQQDTATAENWDTYMAKYAKGPGSVMVNMSLKKSAPDAAYPHLVITGVKYGDCSREGFPSKREFSNLYVISDSVKAVVERNTAAILCGSFTYQCQRLDYFYVSDTSRLRLALSSLYMHTFPLYTYNISIKTEKDWSTYQDFLFPSDTLRDFMDNQKVLMALQRAGDKLTRSRAIDHFAYFKSEADRTCFISYILKKGFRVTRKDNNGEAGLPYALLFTRTDRPAVNTISKVTLDLRRQASRCNGEYNGWETIVIR